MSATTTGSIEQDRGVARGRAVGPALPGWVVERRLGSGGMGTVFLCRDAVFSEERAAVKVLFRESSLPQARERFVREIQALRKLEHPHIVSVRSWGEGSEGQVWLAMDYVQGEQLTAVIRRADLGVDDARQLFQGLADGLAHAHARGIAHRDLKPSNVLVHEGRGVIVDFGVCMDVDASRMTQRGMLPGTPAYMAPEAFRGEASTAELGDIYALGLLLYETLTGDRPFQRPRDLGPGGFLPWLLCRKQDVGALDPGPHVPDDLRLLVHSATEPTPRLRLRSMAAFREALGGRPIRFPSPTLLPAAYIEDLPPEEAPTELLRREDTLTPPLARMEPEPSARAGRLSRPGVWALAVTLLIAALALTGVVLGLLF